VLAACGRFGIRHQLCRNERVAGDGARRARRPWQLRSRRVPGPPGWQEMPSPGRWPLRDAKTRRLPQRDEHGASTSSPRVTWWSARLGEQLRGEPAQASSPTGTLTRKHLPASFVNCTSTAAEHLARDETDARRGSVHPQAARVRCRPSAKPVRESVSAAGATSARARRPALAL